MHRGKSLYRAAILFVALALGATAMMPAQGARKRYRTRTISLAPGVEHTKIRDPKGPWKIHIVSIDLAQASTIEPVLAAGRLPGFERTSSMARRYGAVAAINGDYARESGRPVMTFAQDGELAQTALTWGVNFAVNATETATYIKHQDPLVWFQDETDHIVSQFNSYWPGPDQISGFSHLAGYAAPPPNGACSARLYPLEGPRPAQDRIGIEQPHEVHTVVCKNRKLWPKGGKVVAAPIAGGRAPEILPGLEVGEEVSFGWSLGWPDVYETIGGNPTLVRNGEILVTNENTAFHARHPRSGVGTTADGRVMFVTVDGRQRGYSIGMRLVRFARLFKQLGADFALNLDGGGSTTMVIDGEVANRPSDGSERPVSSALLLLPGADPSPTTSPDPFPSPTSSPTASPTPSPTELVGDIIGGPGARRIIWLEIAQDPASTGGLTQYLLHEGIGLRGSLRSAARIFEAR